RPVRSPGGAGHEPSEPGGSCEPFEPAEPGRRALWAGRARRWRRRRRHYPHLTMRKWLLAVLATLSLAVAACGGTTSPVTDETLPPATTVAPTTPTLPCGDPTLPEGTSLTATAKAEGELAIYDAPDPTAAPSRTLSNPR